ncbi:hypothetical protein L218DRAFT_1001948 [Marasmius fiardii PR-910]|nr:hypothetical protein L218DRAFT_1001948 [Marasmius fiardii PR-910]
MDQLTRKNSRPDLDANNRTENRNSAPSSETPTYSHTIAHHLAHTHLPSISQYRLPSNNTRCKRFIQFARSRSRNKEYLDALKTIEKLLSLTAVALDNFSKTSDQYNEPGTTYPYPSPSTPSETPSDSYDIDYVWDETETASTTSSDSCPTTSDLAPEYSDASDTDISSTQAVTNSGEWNWIANLVVLLWETVNSGKCDVITNPQRNSWSRFIEARYHDWLTGDVASLALDYRDSVDEELRYSTFDFTEYVEEFLMPGRRYGLLLKVLSEHRSLVLPTL